MKNGKNILLFCLQKDTVSVSFHPEVVLESKGGGGEGGGEDEKEAG